MNSPTPLEAAVLALEKASVAAQIAEAQRRQAVEHYQKILGEFMQAQEAEEGEE